MARLAKPTRWQLAAGLVVAAVIATIPLIVAGQITPTTAGTAVGTFIPTAITIYIATALIATFSRSVKRGLTTADQ